MNLSLGLPTAAEYDEALETSVSTPRDDDKPQNHWTEVFESNGYTRVRGPGVLGCVNHGQHILYRAIAEYGFDCTTEGHLPKVRDDVDRVGEWLRGQSQCRG